MKQSRRGTKLRMGQKNFALGSPTRGRGGPGDSLEPPQKCRKSIISQLLTVAARQRLRKRCGGDPTSSKLKFDAEIVSICDGGRTAHRPGFCREVAGRVGAEGLIRDRLESGAVKAREREAAIQRLFSDVGCATDEQKIDKHSGNVICTLPGQTSATIVVGGHFDFADRGQGIIDDWSGASLLPSLYQALKSRPRQHTYVFVAFAAEERGLVGSRRYVSSLTPAQKADVRAFVNLECLGLTPVKVWGHRSTPALVARLDEVAKAIQITVDEVNVENIGDDDTHRPYRRHSGHLDPLCNPAELRHPA